MKARDAAAGYARLLDRRAQLRQPAGLWVLAATEMWERISFHSTQALLTLYLAGVLLLPGRIDAVTGLATLRGMLQSVLGPLSIEALAAQTFGLYISLIYLSPLIGGAIGDRLIGRRAAVTAGAGAMMLGHLALADDGSFLLGLLLLIIGTGLLRGNLSAQIRSLYAGADRRAGDGFQIFYIALCIGAFVAPVISGVLAAFFSWHAALGFAGLGMMVALLVYLAGQRYLPAEGKRTPLAASTPLFPAERRRIFGLLAIWPLIMCFWIAQTQIWNVYNLWVRDFVDLDIGGFAVPIPWLQSLDGLAPALLSPCVLWWWHRLARAGREPDLLAKLAGGCLIFAGAMGLLALSPTLRNPDGRVPLLLPVLFHILSNIGTVFVAPTALALFASHSPRSRRGLMIGMNSLAVFFAGLISGRLGILYGTLAPSLFWLVHVVIAMTAGLTLYATRPALRRLFGMDKAGNAEDWNAAA